MNTRKYAFDWDASVGNLGIGRPGLGPTARVEVYRLFQFTLRDIMEKHYGTQKCDAVLREAGMLAGKHLYERFCKKADCFNDLVRTLQELFKSLGMGILRLETADLDSWRLTLTVDEDLDCSGMPDTNDVICIYDEGLFQGILEAYTGKNFSVREIDCWRTGDRSCRFAAAPVDENAPNK